MAIGDAVTGVVRNIICKERTKSWIGNIAMLFFCVLLRLLFKGVSGAVAGLIASIVEHFEIGPLDNNMIIPLAAYSFY